MYREGVAHGGMEGLRYGSRRDSETVELIAREEDRVDSNVVDIDDEEDGEHGYGAVDYNDSPVQSAGKERREDLAGQRAQHVLRSSHRDTSPLEDECVSGLHQRLAGQVQIDVVNDRSTR